MPPQWSGIETNASSGGLNEEAVVMSWNDVAEDAGLVRPMERHDLPVVAGLIARLAQGHGDASVVDRGALERKLFGSAPWLRGFVVERFDHVVGYALVERRYRAQFSERDLELCQLFVLHGSRGLGLGRRLVDAVVADARAAGCGAVTAGATPGNSGAPAFLGACGFAAPGPVGPRFARRVD
jgi:GNAT superfamily N-acetyltransferase